MKDEHHKYKNHCKYKNLFMPNTREEIGKYKNLVSVQH